MITPTLLIVPLIHYMGKRAEWDVPLMREALLYCLSQSLRRIWFWKKPGYVLVPEVFLHFQISESAADQNANVRTDLAKLVERPEVIKTRVEVELAFDKS